MTIGRHSLYVPIKLSRPQADPSEGCTQAMLGVDEYRHSSCQNHLDSLSSKSGVIDRERALHDSFMGENLESFYATDPDDALVPIFLRTEASKALKQIGTAIFVEFQGEPFLLTAAHVLDEREHGELVVPMAHGMESIEGYIAHVDILPEETRRSDTIDVGYCRLTNGCATKLCFNFKPLPGSRLEIVPDALELGACSVVGYPVSKAKYLAGQYTSETVYLRGVAEHPPKYEALGITPKTNIVICLRAKKVVNRDKKFVNHAHPRGMSGGAIFAWPAGHELSEDWSLPKLVGVFHTYHQAQGLLVGSTLLPLVAAIGLGKMKNFGMKT